MSQSDHVLKKCKEKLPEHMVNSSTAVHQNYENESMQVIHFAAAKCGELDSELPCSLSSVGVIAVCGLES